ncbi:MULTISPECIES: PilX N-terminal domain-containing pilus assembly protein [Pseudomonas]|uniref:Pilus assembly protein PilX n=2 Tax=Pseudomonadaceae TaxID=135621 RepID=A0A0D0KT70_9PSED|nr:MULTISPECIES: PilX N-terminal domain-containing pilus assembly protein [Pseudomonas]KIQ01375.1 pilus assembly protein PilX [Pseudomonas fulva]MCW2294383.1 type IV pilus assembly protein PilX [Pseudomonas sp. BIGb0408]NYH76343.1 type IV pilus assembly protein PilX [Pseudomonas flavescens]
MTQLSDRHSQNGAVLVVALVMLLVLTLMAVGSMRGTTLESRITANRAHDTQQQSAADAALREAEFRYYGPANLADKLEGKMANCQITNTLKANGLNKPCLLAINDADLLNFVDKPWLTKDSFLKSESTQSLLWMPYRGTDAANQTVAGNRETGSTQTTYWNSTRALTVGNAAVNAEYGMVAEGQGTYYYLNNAKADDQVYLQSTHANIYLGLNN